MKILLFVSDIKDTIDKTSNVELEILAGLLNQLKEKHEADEVVFSLCTGDSSVGYLNRYFNMILPIFLKHDIIMGEKFYGSFDKAETIVRYAKKLQKNNEVKTIYYVDDAPMGNAYNGFIESKLENNVYYRFLLIGGFKNEKNINYLSSKQKNIFGIIQALNFQLGNEK